MIRLVSRDRLAVARRRDEQEEKEGGGQQAECGVHAGKIVRN